MSDASGPVQSSVFSTDGLPPASQFLAWRDSNAALFDRIETPLKPAAGYRGEAQVFQFGPFIIGRTRFDPQTYERSASKAAADGVDHHLVRWWREGGYVGRTSRGEVRVRAGDIDVIDFGQPLSARAKASDVIVLAMPKTLLQAAFPQVDDFHGVVVPAGTAPAQLIANHLTHMLSHAPDLAADDIDLVVAAAAAILRVCLRPALEARLRTLPLSDAALLSRLRAHIEDELASRNLTPERLVAGAGVSRSLVYRLFEPFGGVARYIQSRRLHRCMLVLIDPLQHDRQVSAIAFEWGFASESHFSRLFRQTYGVRPSEARQLGRTRALTGRAEARSLSADGWYRRWLGQLGR